MKTARDSERKIKYDDADNGLRALDLTGSAEGRGKYVHICGTSGAALRQLLVQLFACGSS